MIRSKPLFSRSSTLSILFAWLSLAIGFASHDFHMSPLLWVGLGFIVLGTIVIAGARFAQHRGADRI